MLLSQLKALCKVRNLSSLYRDARSLLPRCQYLMKAQDTQQQFPPEDWHLLVVIQFDSKLLILKQWLVLKLGRFLALFSDV